jgi:hypothetical protein
MAIVTTPPKMAPNSASRKCASTNLIMALVTMIPKIAPNNSASIGCDDIAVEKRAQWRSNQAFTEFDFMAPTPSICWRPMVPPLRESCQPVIALISVIGSIGSSKRAITIPLPAPGSSPGC